MVITSGRSAGSVRAVAVDGDPDDVQRAGICLAAQDLGDVAETVRRADRDHRGRPGATRRLNRYSVLHRRPSFAMSASASGGPHSPAS